MNETAKNIAIMSKLAFFKDLKDDGVTAVTAYNR